jgi:hypothetical protein
MRGRFENPSFINPRIDMQPREQPYVSNYIENIYSREHYKHSERQADITLRPKSIGRDNIDLGQNNAKSTFFDNITSGRPSYIA